MSVADLGPQLLDEGADFLPGHRASALRDERSEGGLDRAPEPIALHPLGHGLCDIAAPAARTGDRIDLADEVLGEGQVRSGEDHGALLVCIAMRLRSHIAKARF